MHVNVPCSSFAQDTVRFSSDGRTHGRISAFQGGGLLRQHPPRKGCRSTRKANTALVSRRISHRNTRSVQCVAQVGFDIVGAVDPDSFRNGFFAVVGLSALSFAGTFFVAPQYEGELKKSTSWVEVYRSLVASGLESMSPKDVMDLHAQGATVLDVRVVPEYEEGFIPGSVNVPLYRNIEGWSGAANVRRAAFAFFGSRGSEPNPDWLLEVAKLIPKDKQVVVLCGRGGSLVSKSSKFGYESRSLKAAHQLQQAGYTRVLHMQGGIQQWEKEGLPLYAMYSDDDDDFQDGLGEVSAQTTATA